MELPFIAHVLKSSCSCWTFLWSLSLGIVAWQYVTPHTYPFQNEIQSKRAMDEIQNGLGGRRYLFIATGLCGLKQGELPQDLLEILYDIHLIDKKHWRYLEISWDITTWCIQTTSAEMASFSHQKLLSFLHWQMMGGLFAWAIDQYQKYHSIRMWFQCFTRKSWNFHCSDLIRVFRFGRFFTGAFMEVSSMLPEALQSGW